MRRRFKQNEDESSQDKMLDVNASMQGTLSFKDPVKLRISGRFEGKLDTKGSLMIGEHAEVIADILGEYITIAGVIKGNVKATKEIKIISPASISGNLETPVLSIAEGATLNGNVMMIASGNSSGRNNLGDDALTLDEVAKYLEIEKSVVTEWAENGKLPGFKDGANWKVSRHILENWVSNEKVS